MHPDIPIISRGQGAFEKAQESQPAWWTWRTKLQAHKQSFNTSTQPGTSKTADTSESEPGENSKPPSSNPTTTRSTSLEVVNEEALQTHGIVFPNTTLAHITNVENNPRSGQTSFNLQADGRISSLQTRDPMMKGRSFGWMMKRIATPAAGHMQKQQHMLQHAGVSADGSRKSWEQKTAAKYIIFWYFLLVDAGSAFIQG